MSEKIKVNSEKKNISTNIMNNKYAMMYVHKLIQGSKVPATKWKEPCNQEKISIEMYMEHNVKYEGSGYERNYGIITGKKNNLCVIDIDCQKDIENGKQNIFMTTHGEVNDWVNKWQCPVVKTPSGGYHLYFQEEARVAQTQNEETNIDVRAEGGYIVAPGSVVKGKYYYIIEGDICKIPKMPEELIQFMEKNYKGSGGSKPKTRVKKIKDEKGKEFIVEEIIGCDQSLYCYDYSDYMLENIIKGLPDDYFNSFQKWLIFSTAMKQIDREDLWEKYSKERSNKEYNEAHNQAIYDGITGHKTILAMNHLLLNTSYKNARTTLDYYKYKPTLENKIDGNEQINRRKLGINENDEQEDYFAKLIEYGQRYIMVKSDTGTGKTSAFQRMMANKKTKFLSIVSRQTLGQEQYNNFNKNGVECYYYEYDNFEEPTISYICQIDSILKLRWYASQGWLDDYIVFMDEFNSIIKYLFTSSTLQGVRIPVLDTLLDILDQCKYVFMTDADISDNSIEFIKQNLDKEMNKTLFIENQFKHNQGKEAEELFSYDNIIEKMKDETEMIVCCDEARTCHLIEDELKKHENKKDKKIVVIDRLTKEEILQGFNMDEWDIVIFSPKIVYGLDSTRARPVFCVYQESTIDPKDMVQQINRNRNITKLWFYFMRKKCRDCVFNTFEDCVEDTLNVKKWCEKNDHLHQEMNFTGKMYQDIFNRYKYDEDCFKTNPSAHFRQIIKQRGFKVFTTIAQSKGITGQLKKDKKRRVEDIHPDLPFVQEQNKILNLPEQAIRDNADIFLKSNFISQFLNARTYLFSKHGEKFSPEKNKWVDEFENENERLENFISTLKDKIRDTEEFDINKIKTAKNKILFIEDVRQKLELKSRLTIQGMKVMNAEDAKNYHSEYLATFGSKSKSEENPFETEHGTQKLMIKMYKNVFGCAPFFGKEKKVKNDDGTRTSTWEYKDGENAQWTKMFEIQKASRFNMKKMAMDKYEEDCAKPECLLDDYDDDDDDE